MKQCALPIHAYTHIRGYCLLTSLYYICAIICYMNVTYFKVNREADGRGARSRIRRARIFFACFVVRHGFYTFYNAGYV